MLGPGRKCKRNELKLCQDALGVHLEDFEESRHTWNNAAAIFKTYECFSYERFALKIGEIVHCESYTLPKSRKSIFCIVRYTAADGEVTYMAKMKLAFKLRKTQPEHTLKVALADLYPVDDLSDYLGDYYVDTRMKPVHLNYPVIISRLDHKVVLGNLTRTTVDSLKINKWIFVPYTHVQSYDDPLA